MPFTDQ